MTASWLLIMHVCLGVNCEDVPIDEFDTGHQCEAAQERAIARAENNTSFYCEQAGDQHASHQPPQTKFWKEYPCTMVANFPGCKNGKKVKS